jgi:hypothetical protein
MRTIKAISALLLMATACSTAIAQDSVLTNRNGAAVAAKPEEHYYKLTFRFIEHGNDKTIPVSRTYSGLIRTLDDGTSQIRTNDQFRREFTGDDGKPLYQSYEVGTSIDVRRLSDQDGSLHLRVIADVQQIPAGTVGDGVLRAEAIRNNGEPITRQNKWDSNVIIPIGKPTVIFSSDDVSGQGKMELELTGTLVH